MNNGERDVEVSRSTGHSSASLSPIAYPVVDSREHDIQEKQWEHAENVIMSQEFLPTWQIEMLLKFDMMGWLAD